MPIPNAYKFQLLFLYPYSLCYTKTVDKLFLKVL